MDESLVSAYCEDQSNTLDEFNGCMAAPATTEKFVRCQTPPHEPHCSTSQEGDICVNEFYSGVCQVACDSPEGPFDCSSISANNVTVSQLEDLCALSPRVKYDEFFTIQSCVNEIQSACASAGHDKLQW